MDFSSLDGEEDGECNAVQFVDILYKISVIQDSFYLEQGHWIDYLAESSSFHMQHHNQIAYTTDGTCRVYHQLHSLLVL